MAAEFVSLKPVPGRRERPEGTRGSCEDFGYNERRWTATERKLDAAGQLGDSTGPEGWVSG